MTVAAAAVPAPASIRRGNGGAGAEESIETSITGKHLPALDGLRALAVAGVVAYHLDLGWAAGGYLGVDLFFVLSGFLITSLLLEEWVLTRRIRLGAFWGRRARRLLPALLTVLVAIGLYVVLNGRFGPSGSSALVNLSQLRGDALAALFYVANWHFISVHQPYFEQFSAPSPLIHTWSLAIEEQFYLVWPPLLLVGLHLVRRRWRTVGVCVTVAGAAASAIAMAVLYDGGSGLSRVYYGTDTRIFDMLIGAAVAMVTAARPQPGALARRLLHFSAPVAAVILGVCWVTAGTSSASSDSGAVPPGWMFRGGFLVCALLAALVIADARQVHRGPMGRLLTLPPLPWIGLVSYGIYLWHWPIFVFIDQQRTGLAPLPLDLLRIGLTLGLSVGSFLLIERPVRRRRWSGRLRLVLPAAIAVTAACTVVATVPAIAAPASPAPKVSAVSASDLAAVPGAGGFEHEVPIALAPGRKIDAADPLRVMLLGDSVMYVAGPGIVSALGATGEVDTTIRALPGWGLSTDTGWRTSLPQVIASVHPELIIATWSWDDSCDPEQLAAHEICALQHPVEYTHELESAVRLMLTPGDGVEGVVFSQFAKTGPLVGGDDPAYNAAQNAQRNAGQRVWDGIVRSLPKVFPGRVLYLPVASSVLLHGRFTTWLPPATDPSAPRSRWVRVRMADNVHMCPAGVVRYADALLADMTALYRLPRARPGWWEGSWTSEPRYNDPPGSCPDDHPPG